jgi:hypothetical protein
VRSKYKSRFNKISIFKNIKIRKRYSQGKHKEFMKDKILKWWNKNWSNWEFVYHLHTYNSESWKKAPKNKHLIFKRVSNDG